MDGSSEETKNLLFLLIFDDAEHLTESIKKDREQLKKHVDYLEQNRGDDIEYKELSSASISHYRDITQFTKNKTRIVIWYTGSGRNLNHQIRSDQDQFPCFQGKEILIEQHKMRQKLEKTARMSVIIFDCCPQCDKRQKEKGHTRINDDDDDDENDDDENDALSKSSPQQQKKSFTTLYDFEGQLLINSARENQSSFRRSDRGSTFALHFLENFAVCDSYEETLHRFDQRFHSSLIVSGHLTYEKYLKKRSTNKPKSHLKDQNSVNLKNGPL